MIHFPFRAFLLLSALALTAYASPEEDWKKISAMDSGPTARPQSGEQAQVLARTHLSRQRQALEQFLQKYPNDSRAFEARMRLASIDGAIGAMDGNPRQLERALQSFEALSKTPSASPKERADADFRKVSLQMQMDFNTPRARRDTVVREARRFTAEHRGDPRGPRLLVEAATLCDTQPALKRELLLEARERTTEEALTQRIADDIKRLDQLGRPVDIACTSTTGAAISSSAMKGKPSALVFWAAQSPHSLLWMRDFKEIARPYGDRLNVYTIALDDNRSDLDEAMRELQITWPTHFDGKGWNNQVARQFGINAVPTLWLIDRRGNLRTLNARDNAAEAIRLLLAE